MNKSKVREIESFNNIWLIQDPSNVDGGNRNYYYDELDPYHGGAAYDPITLMADDIQPCCMSCQLGWHDRRFPGHSYGSNNGVGSYSIRLYHPSVEKFGYFRKNQSGTRLLNLFSGKGLFALLPNEIIENIQNYLIDHYCAKCVRHEECNQRMCEKEMCIIEKYCYCTLPQLIETGKRHVFHKVLKK